MYKIRFAEVDGYLGNTGNLTKEIELYFKSNIFEIPIFPYSGMGFDLNEYLDNTCSKEMKNLFSNYMGWEIDGIIFCKNHIDIYTKEPQDHLPFIGSKDLSNTFPK